MFIPQIINIYGSWMTHFSPTSTHSYKYYWITTRTHVKAIDQSSQRCMDQKDHGTSACIARYVEEELGCNPRIHGSRPSSPSRLCNSYSQLKHLVRISRELSKMDANGMYKTTGCMPSCERDTYKVSADLAEVRGSLARGQKYVKLYLYFKDGLFEEREQYLLYDWDSFIADVGGFLGLLLGWSMYSLYQEMAAIVGRMKNKIMPKPRRAKTLKPKT